MHDSVIAVFQNWGGWVFEIRFEPRLISRMADDFLKGSCFFQVLCAAILVIGQVGQNVSLPLWTGAISARSNPNCTSGTGSLDFATSNHTNASAVIDPFFVLSFSSLSFVVIFGGITAVLMVVQILVNSISGRKVLKLITKEDDLLFQEWRFGVLDALNGVFVVFASLPSRTAPFLQAILGNFLIPLTIFFR